VERLALETLPVVHILFGGLSLHILATAIDQDKGAWTMSVDLEQYFEAQYLVGEEL
jgi:hypothetical protein